MIESKFEKANIISSSAIPLSLENVDTDQIIPARFLKAIDRKGFGENLFRDWRFNKDDSVKKDFVLNNSIYKGSILIAGKNFGCGSSREHAAWALYDYGFRAIVSSFFADIFKSNALNNALLPITVSSDFLHLIFREIELNPTVLFEINLQEQFIKVTSTGDTYSFDINPYKKYCLLNGLDDLTYLLTKRDEIKAFENTHIRH